MGKWNKIRLTLVWTIIILGVVAVIAAIVTSIVAVVMYGGKPVTEIPAWALMFMFGNRGK